ncbi:MAG: butyrate kinase [Dehalococcoidia bacterium]|nr:butyrate kinase [Dehalococcoidia bacterium]
MTGQPGGENQYRILVINPGSTSTKTAVYAGSQPICSQTLQHSSSDLKKEVGIVSQLAFRRAAINDFLTTHNIDGISLGAIAARGGLLRPLKGGVYAVNDKMCADLEAARYGEHASNLGALLAKEYADELEIPAYIVDPVTVDEFDPAAKVSGVPGIERKSRLHALNIRAAAQRCASDLGRDLSQTRFVIAHLGGGISVCAMIEGRIVDSTDALLGEGPFSLERAGTLPLAGMIELCLDRGLDRTEIVSLLSRQIGFIGYFGVDQLPAVYRLIDSGNEQAKIIMEAMVRQVARWIGGMTAVTALRPDAVILTGGMVNSARLVQSISYYINHLAPLKVYAGEFEMEALAKGVFRVLNGEVKVQEY